MNDIVLVGGGGHAKVVSGILREIAEYHLIGYTDSHDCGWKGGLDYLGDDDVLPEVLAGHPSCSAVICVGIVGADGTTAPIFSMLTRLGFSLPPIVSPRAHIQEGVIIGSGTIVCNGALINAGSKIGKGCIVNTGSIVEHDCLIDDFVHIAPGAILCGEVSVGRHSMIGAGARVIQMRKIGERCVVGAGAVLIRDADDHGVYVGVPAVKISEAP